MDQVRQVSRASDAAMIVAAGKLIVFQGFWKEVSALARRHEYDQKKVAELRAHVKMAVDSLDDNIFFIRPGHGKTPQDVDAELKRRIMEAHLDEQIMKNLTKHLKYFQPNLLSFLE
jgi:hypothetical protein